MVNIKNVNFYYVGDCAPYYFTECLVAFWLWRTIPFVLLCIGTCGNILNIIVLSGKQLRKYSTTVFILVLAVTELVVLLVALVPDIFLGIKGYRIEDEFAVLCHLRYWILFTAGSYSTWILVLLTIERILLTKAPVFSRKKVTPRNCLIVSLIVLFVIASSNSHVIYGSHFYPDGANASSSLQISENNTAGSLQVLDRMGQFRCYFVTAQYETFFKHYWWIFFLIAYNIVPASIIIIGNINITLVILLRRRGLLSRVHPTITPAEDMRRKASAKLLTILSTFYVLTTSPWCIYWLLRGRIDAHELSGKTFARWQLFTIVANILLWCNFSFNFFFYFVSGTLFKKEWNRLINKIKRRFSRQT